MATSAWLAPGNASTAQPGCRSPNSVFMSAFTQPLAAFGG
jgi:hypothetical protein